jgi:hypothetical protein
VGRFCMDHCGFLFAQTQILPCLVTFYRDCDDHIHTRTACWSFVLSSKQLWNMMAAGLIVTIPCVHLIEGCSFN